MANINIKIEDKLHKKAKFKALEKNITLKELIVDVIEKEVNKR